MLVNNYSIIIREVVTNKLDLLSKIYIIYVYYIGVVFGYYDVFCMIFFCRGTKFINKYVMNILYQYTKVLQNVSLRPFIM